MRSPLFHRARAAAFVEYALLLFALVLAAAAAARRLGPAIVRGGEQATRSLDGEGASSGASSGTATTSTGTGTSAGALTAGNVIPGNGGTETDVQRALREGFEGAEARRRNGGNERGVLVADNSGGVPSPALNDSPYNPSTVNNRIAPPYDPVHERPGYVSNREKTPEPEDARRIWERGREALQRGDRNTGLFRGGQGQTWYAVGERGEIYRYMGSQSGPNGEYRVHWNGVVPANQVDLPADQRRLLLNRSLNRTIRTRVPPPVQRSGD